MRPVSKELQNSLKILEEPQQLDLFEGSFSARNPSPGPYLCHSVCDQLAGTASRAYRLSAAQNKQLCELIVHHCSADVPSTSAWAEYLVGAATALNPLPVSLHSTFWRTDRAALASDWQHVQVDMTRVWQAITAARNIAERLSHERSEQQDRRRDTQVEQADAT